MNTTHNNCFFRNFHVNFLISATAPCFISFHQKRNKMSEMHLYGKTHSAGSEDMHSKKLWFKTSVKIWQSIKTISFVWTSWAPETWTWLYCIIIKYWNVNVLSVMLVLPYCVTCRSCSIVISATCFWAWLRVRPRSLLSVYICVTPDKNPEQISPKTMKSELQTENRDRGQCVNTAPSQLTDTLWKSVQKGKSTLDPDLTEWQPESSR